jgi:hypothetical protein
MTKYFAASITNCSLFASVMVVGSPSMSHLHSHPFKADSNSSVVLASLSYGKKKLFYKE